MNKLISILILIFFLISACQNLDKNVKIQKDIFSTAEDRSKPNDSEPFRLIDQFSNAHALSNYRNKKSVFLVRTKFDSIDRNILNQIIDLEKSHPDSKFLLVSNTDYNNSSKIEQISRPVLADDFGFVIKKYNLTEIGSFAELDPRTGQHIKTDRLTGSAIPSPENSEIFDEERIFSGRVANTFYKQCMQCHMKHSSIDYFTSMSAIQNWRKMMLKTLQVYRMPPGGIDTKVQHQLTGYVSRKELSYLYHWLDQGAIYTPKDEIEFQSEQTKMRTNSFKKNTLPQQYDLKMTMQTVDRIPARGEVYYQTHLLGGPTKEDMYLQAAKFEHNLAVLHHSNVYIFSTLEQFKTKKFSENLNMLDVKESKTKINVFLNDENIRGWAILENAAFSISRSAGIVFTQKGTGVFVPKGSYLAIENHYHPNGAAETNQSSVSFYKYRQPQPPNPLQRIIFRPNNFNLLPNQNEIELRSVLPIKKDITLLTFVTHMHYRGKDTKLFVKDPSGHKKLIFSVPYYQVNLEMPMSLTTPLKIESGSEIELVVHYDNSNLNVSNPDPTKKISFGNSTYNNEMHSMRLYFYEDN